MNYMSENFDNKRIAATTKPKKKKKNDQKTNRGEKGKT